VLAPQGVFRLGPEPCNSNSNSSTRQIRFEPCPITQGQLTLTTQHCSVTTCCRQRRHIRSQERVADQGYLLQENILRPSAVHRCRDRGHTFNTMEFGKQHFVCSSAHMCHKPYYAGNQMKCSSVQWGPLVQAWPTCCCCCLLWLHWLSRCSCCLPRWAAATQTAAWQADSLEELAQRWHQAGLRQTLVGGGQMNESEY